MNRIDDATALSSGEALLTLIRAPDTLFVMEAHDAVSAALAQRAGFRALWASGLTISSVLGYRDANEASWTEVAEAVERIATRVGVPVLVDADTGFGNFNNVRQVARRLTTRGAAGLCLEDKLFPKMNSFVGDRHPLAEIGEFCGRLQAAKDAAGEALTVVARIEAFIAGHGLAEALRRAHAYAEAGADAVLIHSRRPDAAEILAFAEAWRGRLPVVIVPTTYYRTPTAVFREAGIAAVIWANHGLRAGIAAMEQLYTDLHRDESLVDIEGRVAPLERIFDLFDYAELARAETRYLAPAPVAA